MLNQIMKSKFLWGGMIIGLLSANFMNLFFKPASERHNSLPMWMFIVPPILFFIMYKVFKTKKA